MNKMKKHALRKRCRHCVQIDFSRYIITVLGATVASLNVSIVQHNHAYAGTINVDCYSNSDGTVSCKRLNDGEWFDCARSIGGARTCKSREVVRGVDAPITCIDNGANVFSCTNNASKNNQSDGLPLGSSSVF